MLKGHPLLGRLATALRPREREAAAELGDFTTTWRVVPISFVAIAIGLLGAVVAFALLKLIGLFTNLFFFQRWDTSFVSPTANSLGYLEVFVPMIGGLMVGLMARYGSERIRGHGIPEALESILITGSRVEPGLAFWKPISAAISIGSGGPFGAEGPIIMTGGAFGSIVAQALALTAAERKTLLVAGAAAGMSATFASPIAAVVLAVELLLFEWKPRSLVPVALASATAAAARYYVLGLGPLFPVPPHPAFIGTAGLMGCLVAGLLAGALSAFVTVAVYAAEDAFLRLPIHWMWWPALGGIVVGLGGLIVPQALGVGYDTIGRLLGGDLPVRLIVSLLVVKALIWSVSLGSGTSGGVLAPLLLMGGALGGIEATFLPNEGHGFWPLISMAATLGGTMRSPFTGVIFALELTHDLNVALPLLVAVAVAHGVTVLALRRSILTEKVSRRGFHLSREYAIDPLEILFVREVMRPGAVTLGVDSLPETVATLFRADPPRQRQLLYPVVGADSRLVGVVTRNELQGWLDGQPHDRRSFAELIHEKPVVAYPDEPLRAIVQRMAETSLTRFPVVERSDSRRVVGMIGLFDLLEARVRNLEAERRRERILPLTLRNTRHSGGSNSSVG
ncbi:MAG TPA: chloride channel protein [Deltaproteobacteria bacterium]|jgi:H+/Cl- antiporter ClcA|nr:chloride channel protein [Deltaproteobacteria bacterium]